MKYRCKIVRFEPFDEYQTLVKIKISDTDILALSPIPYDDAKSIYRNNSINELDIYVFSSNIVLDESTSEYLLIDGNSVLFTGNICEIYCNELFRVKSKLFNFDIWSLVEFDPNIGKKIICKGSFEVFPVEGKWGVDSCWL